MNDIADFDARSFGWAADSHGDDGPHLHAQSGIPVLERRHNDLDLFGLLIFTRSLDEHAGRFIKLFVEQ